MKALFALSLFSLLCVTSLLPTPVLLADELAAPWEQAAQQTKLYEARDAVLPTSLRSAFGEFGARRSLWVCFTDKGIFEDSDYRAAVGELFAAFEPRALHRRQLRRTASGLFDGYDLPVVPAYVAAVAATGAQRRVVSRWLNAVSVRADLAQAEAIARLPFVQSLRLVRAGRRPATPFTDTASAPRDGQGNRDFYGLAQVQLDQINLPALHARGYTGEGILIGVLDTGFRRDHVAFQHPEHPLTVVAEWDFVNDDPNTDIEPGDDPDQHFHGTAILGTLGTYAPDEMVGAAFDADYVLAKVEDAASEYPLEEDWFAAGLEYLEAQGCDVATSSVVAYWYEQDAMDGVTSVMAQAFNIATANGLHCCQGVGNSGHDDDPATSHMVTPADAFQVLSCGSVDINSDIASFSSDGPTTDGRVKPEVLARGQNAWTISAYSSTDYTTESGASIATPQLAGAVACLVQAHPDWSVDTMRERLTSTGDYYLAHGVPDPLFVQGFGLVDVAAADSPPTSVADFGDVEARLDSRAFPNPFAGATNIHTSLPASGSLRLEVFDIRGRRLKSVDYGVRAGGGTQLLLDGSDLSTGVHCYRLLLDDQTVAKGRLLILR